MRFSQPKREEISLGISIAPLIDIIFLLLIFFMLTSHFEIISGIDIRLPDISEKSRDRSDDNVVVRQSGNMLPPRGKSHPQGSLRRIATDGKKAES